MQNHYEILGVAHDATPAIVKIAYEGKLRALARTEPDEAARKAEERRIEQAYAVLSNPAKKQWYDRQLQAAEAKSSHGSRMGLVAGAGVLVLVLAGGAAWYSQERTTQRERVRLEEQRIAIEGERLRAQAEIDKARLLDTQSRERTQVYRREVEQRRSFERERRYQDSYQRSSEDRDFQGQVRERVISTHDERERQRNEDRDRRQADEDRRKAWAEVERQKRFVAEREREDERIRTERHYRAQREAAEARAREEAEKRRQ